VQIYIDDIDFCPSSIREGDSLGETLTRSFRKRTHRSETSLDLIRMEERRYSRAFGGVRARFRRSMINLYEMGFNKRANRPLQSPETPP